MTDLRKKYGDDHMFVNPSIPVGPAKRSRASHRDMLNPCCQVEGCNLDLKSAKSYHRRHRICESHSKSPRVVVAGLERRFCQQCSRFHDLSEFDENKRSCRRRLSDHNARRRRAQPESVQLLSSALYDQRRESLLLEGLPVSNPNSGWEDGDAYVFRQWYSDQRLRIPTAPAPAPINVQSLLSSSSWGSNEGQPETQLFKEAAYE